MFPMTLRKKTLIIVTGTLIGLIVVLYFAISTIVRGSFEDLEQEDVNKHVQRVDEALDNQLSEMAATLGDWAKPGQVLDVGRLAGLLDDERARVSDQRGNKLADLLANLELNVFLFTDSSDNILWGWAYDEENQKLALVPKSLRDQLKNSDSPLLRHPEGFNTLSGVVILPENPMLIVSVPLRTPAGEGNQGSMIMGRYLDEAEVARLAELTRLDVAVNRLDADLPADALAARSFLTVAKPIHVEPLDSDFVSGYTELADVFGNPALLWRVTVPRDIIDEGNKSINFLLYALVVVGVVLVVVIAFLLDKLVLSRMARLNNQVSGISMASDLTTRVDVPGRDELSNLGSAINGMLGEIQTERGRSETLLLNVLPPSIAERLKGGEGVIADSFDQVSVLFSDVVGFTKLSAEISAAELVDMLNQVFSAFDNLTDRHGLEKIKTIGDAYMVVGGLPDPRPDHAEAVAEMAKDMYRELDRLNRENGTSLNIRIGINSGPVVAGVIGTKKFIYNLWGDTVNTAARMESHGVEGRIHMTELTQELLQDKYQFEDRGIIDVKGKGDMHTFLLAESKVVVGQESAATDGE